MKRLWLVPIILLVVAFLVWQLWLTLLIGVKEPAYKLIAKKDGYELRKIQPYLIASVDLVGSYEQTINDGFKILFAYISGNNYTQTCMRLNKPLLQEICRRGESIAMTTPVLIDQKQQEQYRISFVMPQEYTLATLPVPRDQRIILEQQQAKIIAVYSFTWYPTVQRIEEHTQLFKQMLKRDSLCVRSAIMLARYNPPFIVPFLMRNELIAEVAERSTEDTVCRVLRD